MTEHEQLVAMAEEIHAPEAAAVASTAEAPAEDAPARTYRKGEAPLKKECVATLQVTAFREHAALAMD